MSKVVKKVKKGLKSAGRKLEGAVKGDLDDIASVLTLGGSDLAEDIGKKLHKPFKAPDPLPAPGISQANVAEAAPSVDIARTEQSRRVSGSAVGTRRLRVPLGGLR